MKKYILSAAILAFVGVSVSQADNKNLVSSNQFAEQDTTVQQQTPTEAPVTPDQPAAEVAPQTSSTDVKLEELPEAVKTTLTADIFKEWVPSSATLVTSDGKQHYQIEVKKGEETRAIKIGEDGKVVE
jgi:hypothetical protein